MYETQANPIRRLTVSLNGITVGYIMALINAAFVCMVAFGIALTDQEIGAMGVLLNTALALVVHLSHRVGEATASGQSGAVSRAQTAASGEAAQQRNGGHLEPPEDPKAVLAP